MADTVDSVVLRDGGRKYTIRLTNISDGTGESAVVKVDLSTLTNLYGATPSMLAICSAQWSIQGFTSVRILWDATTDDEAMVLTGNGYREFDPPLQDPQSSGAVGDLILTTDGAVSGATYDILLDLIKA